MLFFTESQVCHWAVMVEPDTKDMFLVPTDCLSAIFITIFIATITVMKVVYERMK